MSNQYVLAHDFGTSGDKACIFDTGGNFLAEAYYPIKTYYPQPDWAEQCPEEWWQAVKDATHEVVAKSGVAPKEVKAISFSSHGMTAIPIDKDGNLLLDRVMTWMDARSTKEAEYILRHIGARQRYEKTGNSFDVTLYPSSKLLWMKRNMPEIYNRAVKFLNPKEYLAYRMTGTYRNTDYGEAGMSGLYNMNTHRWDEELMRISGVDEEKLLVPAENTTPVGNLTKQAAAEMGLTTDTLVVLGSWDNYACALGGGVRKENTFVTCLGTAGWVGVNNESPLITDRFMSNVVYVGDGTYFTSVHSHSACAAYEWVVQNLCADLREKYGKQVYETATELAIQAGAGANGVFFLPSMFSGNTFYSDASLAGSLVGLKMHHTRADILRAAMEGPAFDLMMGVDFYKMMGVMADEARLIGGGANNRLWMQILSNMFGVKMIRPKNLQYIGALGAALIAGVGADLISSLDAVSGMIQFSDSAQPDDGEMEKYRQLLPAFKHFYESLMPAYKELSQFIF
ncbi:xylulokinase [Christensenella tenuis]|uniref:Xylulokinase n=1 Tax=Christensenella tenuis TaxID=2763033 RepID=A0ABR7EGJ5_9FIRM|nr:FGGY family carbohydrate kinase [Christensenella tenuis]MBC5648869.1 hypothetical protein [Christensenella tenuis]